MTTWKIWLAGVGWASIFGFSFIVTKGALDAFSPFELLFLRFSLATIVLAVLVGMGFVKLRFRDRPRLPLLLICLFQPLLYFTFETYGLRISASSTAGIILGSLPAAVAALSIPMLKERLSLRQTVGLLGSVAGVVLIVLQGTRSGADSLLGILLIVAALISAAFYNVFSRRASAHYGPVETTFAMMASGALGFGLLALIDDTSRFGSSRIFAAPPSAWLAVAYLGLLSSVLAFFLVNLSLSRLKASQASIFGTLVTLVAMVAGLLFRAEGLAPSKLLGALAVLSGVWAMNAREGAGSAENSLQRSPSRKE